MHLPPNNLRKCSAIQLAAIPETFFMPVKTVWTSGSSKLMSVLIKLMTLVTRKPVFGVCDQGRLKPVYAATEASKRLEILDIETRVLYYLSSEQQRR